MQSPSGGRSFPKRFQIFSLKFEFSKPGSFGCTNASDNRIEEGTEGDCCGHEFAATTPATVLHLLKEKAFIVCNRVGLMLNQSYQLLDFNCH